MCHFRKCAEETGEVELTYINKVMCEIVDLRLKKREVAGDIMRRICFFTDRVWCMFKDGHPAANISNMYPHTTRKLTHDLCYS